MVERFLQRFWCIIDWDFDNKRGFLSIEGELFGFMLNRHGFGHYVSLLMPFSSSFVQECESSNPNVRKIALSVIGDLHSQIGPMFRALALTSCPETSPIKGQLERTFEENPFDNAAARKERSKKCVVLGLNSASKSYGAGATSALLVLPKTDLVASLSADCIEKMVRCDFDTLRCVQVTCN